MPYRPTGIGAFGFSLNWDKVPGDEEVARRVVTFLEDRRLLFGKRHTEDELECVHSAIMSRAFLTDELQRRRQINHSRIACAMRAAFRQFGDAAGPNARNFRGSPGGQVRILTARRWRIPEPSSVCT
jgi:hypothetical protein